MKRTTLLCLFSALLGGLLAVALYDPPDTETPIVAQQSPRQPWSPPLVNVALGSPEATPQPPPAADLTPEERINVAVYETGNRSAVNITTKSVQIDFFLRELTAEGEGSGTVVDRKGHILTNFHVIQGARDVRVTLFDGNSYDAEPIGVDPATDLAVLKIDAPAESLFPTAWGDSTGLRVGQRVYAIGNPFGLERTLSTGIIASLNRSINARRDRRSLRSIIQIDAAINPGNSGGPLLDSHGRMIGMNTAIASRTGESAGVGFAIPINTIRRVVPQLIQHGRVVRPAIGVVSVSKVEDGLRIVQLVPGGPAEAAGLKGPQLVVHSRRQGPITYKYQTVDRAAADVIVAVDGKRVRTGDDLLDAVESKKPGDKVVLSILRDNKPVQVTVPLVTDE